jgi:Glycosyltransferase family 20
MHILCASTSCMDAVSSCCRICCCAAVVGWLILQKYVLCFAGFHTFDYARHFLSCCARMLGLEHVTSRGSIMIEYYGRNVGVKIMPTGVKPDRFLSGFAWGDTQWRRGELLSQVGFWRQHRHAMACCCSNMSQCRTPLSASTDES